MGGISKPEGVWDRAQQDLVEFLVLRVQSDGRDKNIKFFFVQVTDPMVVHLTPHHEVKGRALGN